MIGRTFSLDTINKTVNLAFEHNKEISDKLKDCDFNTRWNPELLVWVVPVNTYSKNRISYIIREYGFVQIQVKQERDVESDYTTSSDDLLYLKTLCDEKRFNYTPREYQLESLRYGLDKGSIINGDDVGLGKTMEAIMYAETTNSFPCIVIVPASVKYNWQEKWYEIVGKHRTVAVIESKETVKHKNNWDADVVVINYDILSKKAGTGATHRFEQLLSTEWKMAIVDEAHFLKNKTSQRSAIAKRILKDIEVKQLLTGTATMSRPVELWNLLLLIGKEKAIANDWHQFIRRYCGGYRGKFGWVTDGATNTIELNKKLRDSCYIRREKRDVLKELPEVTKQVLKTPITNKREIVKATTDLIQYISETKGDEAAEKAMEAEHLVALNVLRKLAIAGKLKAIEQYLKDWKESGVKLLIFGLHREELDYLSNKFKSKLIAGGMSSVNKQKTVKEWIKNDDVFLFANMQSAGTGVDGLQKVCSNMLIIELPWRPSDLVQVHGRLERSGQKNATTITYMLNDEETIDKEMWQMLEAKEVVTDAVNKGIDVRKSGSGMKAVLKKLLKRKNN